MSSGIPESTGSRKTFSSDTANCDVPPPPFCVRPLKSPHFLRFHTSASTFDVFEEGVPPPFMRCCRSFSCFLSSARQKSFQIARFFPSFTDQCQPFFPSFPFLSSSKSRLHLSVLRPEFFVFSERPRQTSPLCFFF